MDELKKLFTMNKYQWWFLIIILLVASVPRGIELLNHNYLFGFDQGEHLLQVKKIVVDRTPTLIGTLVGGGGFFQGPGWYYLLSIPFFLSNGDPYASMILMFLLGIGTVFFSFIFLRKMFDIKSALFVSLLIAISPLIITQSRFIWPPFPISFLTVFFLYFLYRTLEKNERFFPLLAFILGMMTHFETATAATLLVSFLPMLLMVYIKKLVSLRSTVLAFFALVLTQLPLIVFDLKHEFLNIRGIFQMILSPSGVQLSFSQLLENRWGNFRDNFIGTFQLSEQLWPLLLIVLFVGVILYLKDKKKSFADKSFVTYLTISPLLLFLVFLKIGVVMWGWWILQLSIGYCFLFGILFSYLLDRKYGKILILGLTGVMFAVYIFQTIQFYKYDFNDFGGFHKIKGKMEAFDYIYKDANGQKFNLLVFTPPIYTYAYDYMTWWYGRQKYGYIPGNEKKGTFYLLMEPDPQKPWTYKGWLETVVKSGKIIKTEELPSGFIIQKREEE